MPRAHLETCSLTKSYSGTLALAGVDLRLDEGVVTALVGRNGAGKSTLVKLLSGAIGPTDGTIAVGGVPMRFASPLDARAAGIATVHQELSLVEGLSVAENVLFGRYPRRGGALRGLIAWSQLYAQAGAMLDALGIPIDPRRTAGSLSLAERHMVEIARALGAEARVLLLDEPTAGLARAEVQTLFRLVRAAAARGAAVLYVTHRLAELGEIADVVIGLRDGLTTGTVLAAEASSRALVAMLFDEEHARDRSPVVSDPDRRDASREPLLEVTDLCVPGSVEGASFVLHRGEVLGIAGMLGSGRTELLMGLFGGLRASRGTVRVHADPRETPTGISPTPRIEAAALTPGRARALGLALVPEERVRQGLVLSRSVLDNACLASLDRIAPRWLIGRAHERRVFEPLAEQIDIQPRDPARPIASLSGGNQQKVVIAKWLARRPQVLLFDEPTRGIDIGAKAQVFDLIRGLARDQLGAIVVSSELEELLDVCDRILVMRAGRIVAETRAEAIDLQELFARVMGEAA